MELFQFDERYVARLKADDPATQEHFFSYFSELLLIKLRARYLSPDQVEDMRQETFVRVLAALKKDSGLQNPERIGAFVNSVCNNVLLEFFRANGRAQSLDDDAEPPDHRVDLNRGLVSEDAKRQVSEILKLLPERDRRVLYAIFVEEKSKDQICYELKIERDYLRVLLHRAKHQFRERYSESRFSHSTK